MTMREKGQFSIKTQLFISLLIISLYSVYHILYSMSNICQCSHRVYIIIHSILLHSIVTIIGVVI